MLAALCLAPIVIADPIEKLKRSMLESELDSKSWVNGKYVTGNWGGVRDDLVARSLEPFLFYTNIMSGNPVGGREQGFTYADDFYFGVKLDLEKLAGWSGAKFTISGVNRDGRGLTEHYVGSRAKRLLKL